MSDTSLGIYAKFSVTSESESAASWVARRFMLQAAARELLPEHRVRDCCRRPVPGETVVEVWWSSERERASYRKLQTCGAVWVCPVCAARITEGRRVELQQAIDNERYRPVLVTLTVRHCKDDELVFLLGRLLAAYHQFNRNRSYKNLKRDYAIVGAVKSLEVTYGRKHGWHPHLHVLMFLDCSSSAGFEGRVREMWLAAVASVGLDASWERGANVKDAWKWIAEYVAKWGREPVWGVDREVVKGQSKGGRLGGRTPHQLLADYVTGDRAAGELWREYVTAFRGRSQLRWSKGLRELLGLAPAASDDELARAVDSSSWLLASLTLRQWAVVCELDKVGELLAVAQIGDHLVLWDYLNQLPGMLDYGEQEYHPAFRSVGNLRPGDAVKWMSGESGPGRGYVREVRRGQSRVLVDVWGGASVAQMWIPASELMLIRSSEGSVFYE